MQLRQVRRCQRTIKPHAIPASDALRPDEGWKSDNGGLAADEFQSVIIEIRCESRRKIVTAEDIENNEEWISNKSFGFGIAYIDRAVARIAGEKEC